MSTKCQKQTWSIIRSLLRRASAAVAALVRYWTNASEGDETVYEKARAITRASKNVEVWNGSAQVGWPNALVTRLERLYGRERDLLSQRCKFLGLLGQCLELLA